MDNMHSRERLLDEEKRAEMSVLVPLSMSMTLNEIWLRKET